MPSTFNYYLEPSPLSISALVQSNIPPEEFNLLYLAVTLAC